MNYGMFLYENGAVLLNNVRYIREVSLNSNSNLGTKIQYVDGTVVLLDIKIERIFRFMKEKERQDVQVPMQF